jgi:hypothetical protein
MPPYNMAFTLFLLDPRSFEELRPSLDEMFGGQFVEDLESKAEGRLQYTNYVLGLTIGCFYEETWTEGKVYRLAGSNDNCCRFDTLEQMDMGFHIRQLLSNVGLVRIMAFEEFRDESKRRNAIQE